MFSNNNNEVTEGLLIAVLGANFVLLFFIAWQFVTARLYFRQVAIMIGKMDCDELIDVMLSCSGGTAEQQPYEATAGDSLASPATPDAVAGQQRYEVTGQKAPDRLQKYRERLASVAVGGGQARRYGLLAHGKALTASHIEELDDSEIERLYARYEARLGAAMTKILVSEALQLYAKVVSMFLPISADTNQGLLLTSRATRLSGTHLAVPPASYSIVMACS